MRLFMGQGIHPSLTNDVTCGVPDMAAFGTICNVFSMTQSGPDSKYTWINYIFIFHLPMILITYD